MISEQQEQPERKRGKGNNAGEDYWVDLINLPDHGRAALVGLIVRSFLQKAQKTR
jgi:hypothetical protein